MASIRDVAAYICSHYPHKHELSKARLTKMVYLADWKSAIDRGRQMTEINWEFNYYGPFVNDVVESVRHDPEFEVMSTVNVYGEPKELIRLTSEGTYPSLDDWDQSIIQHVIEKTAPRSWDKFIRLVYSTYPILTQPRFSKLDLVCLAKQYLEDNIGSDQEGLPAVCT